MNIDVNFLYKFVRAYIKMNKALIMIAILALCILVSCGQEPPDKAYATHSMVLENPQDECARVGGTWKVFSDGCVDSCYKERSTEAPLCAMAMTPGCDCGETKCWSGYTCEDN